MKFSNENKKQKKLAEDEGYHDNNNPMNFDAVEWWEKEKDTVKSIKPVVKDTEKDIEQEREAYVKKRNKHLQEFLKVALQFYGSHKYHMDIKEVNLGNDRDGEVERSLVSTLASTPRPMLWFKLHSEQESDISFIEALAQQKREGDGRDRISHFDRRIIELDFKNVADAVKHIRDGDTETAEFLRESINLDDRGEIHVR